MGETAQINEFFCEGCGVCSHFCPEGAIFLEENRSGWMFISETRYGPFFHAELEAGEENSGKLVTLVKQEARKRGEAEGLSWMLVDGPPGLGCPVISSLSGANFVLMVTEPTKSGLHDLKRVLKLVEHFKLDVGVCINRWDLNVEQSERIEKFCDSEQIPFLGKIPFDEKAVESTVAGIPLVEYSNGAAAQAICSVWNKCLDAA